MNYLFVRKMVHNFEYSGIIKSHEHIFGRYSYLGCAWQAVSNSDRLHPCFNVLGEPVYITQQIFDVTVDSAFYSNILDFETKIYICSFRKSQGFIYI